MSWDVAGITLNGLTGFLGTQGRPQFQAPPHAAPVEKKPNAELAQQAIRNIEQFSNFLNRRLKYSIDQATDQVIVKVIDGDTDKVIKELPPEELQRIHHRIREAIGLLFDQLI